MSRFLTVLLTLLTTLPCLAQDRPRVPIMGWASWNNYRININETIIKSQADAMVSSGLKDAGYQYVNIDDGFFGGRDSSGELLIHPTKFPNGMKSVADYIHSKGLKAGIYSEAGTNTCGFYYDNDGFGEGAGLLGHEMQDLALMLQTWNYDFIKIDWCGGLRESLNEKDRYTEIGRVIRLLKPEAVYNICRWQYPGNWGKFTADSWRVSGDIEATFASVMHIVDICEPLWIHSSPGHFNDMDMLQVGRGMSTDEDKAHFSMWCMMNSPLLAGNDLAAMSQATIDILTNPEIIALNQDLLCYQARRLRDDGETELWAKPLGARDSGDVAVTLLNRSSSSKTISFNLSEIGIDPAAGYSIRDLWARQDLNSAETNSSQSFTVPSHGVVVLRIIGQATANHPFTKAPGWDYTSWASEIDLSAANSDPFLDPDHDGLNNLTEYTFDSFHPLQPDASHELKIGTEGGLPAARFTLRNTDDAVVTPYFQFNTLDASSWAPVVHGENGISYTKDAFGSVITMQPEMEPSGFLKLGVELNEVVTTDPNWSFETPVLAPGTWNSTTPANWIFVGSSGGVENVNSATRYGSAGFGTSPNKLNGQGGDGDQVAYVNLASAGAIGSATSPVIAIIEPETTYVVTIAFGQRSSGVKLPIARFGLKLYSTELGSFTDVPGRSLGTGFHDFTYQWTSPAAGDELIGKPLRLQLDFTYDAVLGGAQQAQFDNIRFSTGGFAKVAIVNGSFEENAAGSEEANGWTPTAGTTGIGVGAGGSNGSKYLYMGPGMEITQDLGHVLKTGEKLTLKFDSERGTDYPRRVQLLAKNGDAYSVIAQTEQEIGGSTWPTTQLTTTVAAQVSGQELAIRIFNTAAITYKWLHFDNFRLTVGEPPAEFIDGWKLVCQDEFNAQSIDSNTWSAVTRGSPNWKDTMSTAPEMFGIGDGRLHLKGKVNTNQSTDSAPFLTGGLTSQGKYSFQYGKIVIRARFGSAQGAWPALWLLGNNGGWPSNGEIDLMEHLNYENKVHQTVHSDHTWYGGNAGNAPQKMLQTTINPNVYNTYGAEWDADNVIFTINGVKTLTYPRQPAKGDAQWPFKQPFYIILSMQIGGSWPGAGNPADGNYPIEMEVDWIRVYQKD